MADTTIKLSGTYDSIEAYKLLEEMRSVASSYLPLTGGEISGDLVVDGQISGNVAGTASGNLPLSGGTMTGPIVANGTNIIKSANDTSHVRIAGGTSFEDSYIGVWGKNNSTSPGSILLRAYDGTNAQSLLIGATALPTFAGQTIDAIAAESATASGYISYRTGLKMCWTTVTLTSTNYSTGVKWTFPDSGFSSAPVVLISANGPTPTYYNSNSTTSVTIKSNQISANLSCSVFAIGVKI